MRDLIGRLKAPVRKSDSAGAVEVIRAGAAYLSQGASYSYLRARTLLAGPRLFSDEGFGLALTICKWEGFAVAAQDLILILETDLRPMLPARPERLAPVLFDIYKEVLQSEPVPEHRAEQGWADAIAEFETRLPVFLSKSPLKPDSISIATALKLLDHAPIDPSVREADQMMVVNNTAFRFIEYQTQMRRALDYAGLVDDLTRQMEQAA
jgi:hypothetical protein